jgi:hypothetical protein
MIQTLRPNLRTIPSDFPINHLKPDPMFKVLCVATISRSGELSCCFSHRYYRPCLFFKNEVILGD